MQPNDYQISVTSFPFTAYLSLKPIISYWQRFEDDCKSSFMLCAQEISRQLKEIPEILEPITDLNALGPQHTCLIDLLMTAIFPPATHESEASGAVGPRYDASFYYTQPFKQIILNENKHLKRPLNIDEHRMLFNRVRMVYLMILEKFYQVQVPHEEFLIYTVPDYQLGLYRHYNVVLNTQFLDITLTQSLPELSEEDIQTMLDNIRDMDIWMELLPPQNFEISGFYIMNLLDVTDQEVLSSLKNDLLERDVMLAPDRFEQLQEKIRVLFKRPHLQLGVAAFHKNKSAFVNFGNKINHSFLLQSEITSSSYAGFKAIYDELVRDGEPLVIKNVENTEHLPDGVREEMLSMGIRNIVLALLRYGNDPIGILELGSPNPGDLDNFSITKVEQFLPLFSVAVNRNSEEIEARVQSVIREKFTAIHPVLEWRFREAAMNLLDKINASPIAPNPEMEAIIFPDVYPLYAVADVRGSSTERNTAILGDLVEHLQLAERILKKAVEVHSLPILDELRFSVSKHLRQLKKGVLIQDGITIFETLRTQVEPMFQFLEVTHPELVAHIQDYRNAMDPTLGILYKRRKAFEESLTLINETISEYVEQEELNAQQMYPHYFERFVTDGVEFNIYVGQSLVENQPFDLMFLRNLRLWQLMVICEVAQRTHALKPKLKVPLETTQLILIHSQPLAIRFRQDERKFDVDGAYNIRYEIVKKRIDKALVRDTEERLTQPGKIAIVYSQVREANEYLEYIEYLQNKGILTEHVEQLEVEDLQGVSGLKALRVQIKV
ncbi:GAF domain-containing protein [Rufibacter latericius]|uniref:GAF domain-containing protein n=1 Tax=Rufibacter latericius TaxID=2487040 RepID=A0A3M9MK31_9BACT|nr:GAF domain-containing protein [Rufibacter latericius]RNI25874.1 GAF domain-containing protein [Rufibacter latericius]